jgi:hypothetical protein
MVKLLCYNITMLPCFIGVTSTLPESPIQSAHPYHPRNFYRHGPEFGRITGR